MDLMTAVMSHNSIGEHDRELFHLESLKGMPEPDDDDVKQSGEPAASILERTCRDASVWAVASLDEVRANVLGVGYPEHRIHFVAGRVEETLPEHAPPEIALLRLDTDWYASTKHELVHLYPRLAAGGVLVIDDYAYWRGARQAVDEYVRENDLKLLLIRSDHGARVAIKA